MPAEAPRPERDEVVKRLTRDAAAFPGVSDTRPMVVTCADLRTILARLAQAERERDTAVLAVAEWAQKAGEAEGKLHASELAGMVEGWQRRAEEAERLAGERLEALRRPARMEDVRLAVGEGTLSPLDIIAGCNAEFRRRAALTAPAEGMGEASA